MKPPYQMISQDEAKLYRERAEKAEAEVARLRALLPVDGSHMPSIVDLLEDRVKVLEATLRAYVESDEAAYGVGHPVVARERAILDGGAS